MMFLFGCLVALFTDLIVDYYCLAPPPPRISFFSLYSINSLLFLVHSIPPPLPLSLIPLPPLIPCSTLPPLLAAVVVLVVVGIRWCARPWSRPSAPWQKMMVGKKHHQIKVLI